MKNLFVLAAAAAIAVSDVSAHYIFEKLDNYDVYQYIRKNTNYNSPVTGEKT